MGSQLFYENNESYFDEQLLRAAARTEVETSSLIQRAGAGDLSAASALHREYWAFVYTFEKVIDWRFKKSGGSLYRMLCKKFGPERTKDVWQFIRPAVNAMQKEEKQHSKHWATDAECLGIHHLDSEKRVPGVQALIDAAYADDFCEFFAVLAATEFIAEELSKFLIVQPAYTQLFNRGRWVWGEIHAEPHQDEIVSHLLIDLDLARASTSKDEEGKEKITSCILNIIRLFGQAARDAEAQIELLPQAA